MKPRPEGRPQKPATDLAARIAGMPRFSIEVPVDLLAKVDRSAEKDQRSRAAQIRVLLGEALAARKAAGAS